MVIRQTLPSAGRPAARRLTGMGLSVLLAAVALAAVSLMTASAGPASMQDSARTPEVTCATNVGGAVTTHTTWLLANSPYCTTGGVTVNAGITLTVEPGVTVYFTAGHSLNVNGTLFARGTQPAPIVFTSRADTPVPGGWVGLSLNAGSRVRLEYCDVGYTGGSGDPRAMYIWSGSDVQLGHCRIHHSAGNGLILANTDLAGLFTDLEIDHNAGFPVVQTTQGMNPTYRNLAFHDNGTDALLINGATAVYRNVTLDGSPAALNGAPIYLASTQIQAGYTLTVTPGTTLKITTHGSVSAVGGSTLIVEGTAAQPITVTSQAATPAPGDWGNLSAASGSHVRLAYCDVGYAGYGGDPFTFYIWAGSDVQMRHCRVHHSAGNGLVLGNDGLTGVFEDLEIDHNGAWPVLQTTQSMNPTYTNLRFHDNGTDALLINGATAVYRNVTLDGSPAALNGAPIYLASTQIQAGYTLTVTPGTTLKIATHGSVSAVGGSTLIVEGTAAQPITVTSQAATPAPGDWANLNAASGSHVRLAYCDVGYAGYGGDPFTFYIWSGSDVQMRHCRVHHSAGNGLVLGNTGLTGVFEDLEIDHNAGFPVVQTTLAMNPTYANLTFHDNGTNALTIGGGSILQYNVTLDGRLLNGAPIYLVSTTVYPGYTLTVTAGTTLKMNAGASLQVNGGGALIAEGTPAEPITFTSQSAEPEPGDWNHILANSGSRLRLTNCDIGYAGVGSGNHALWVTTSDVQIYNCRIHHSAGDALFVNGVQILVRNLALVDSAAAGMSLVAAARVDGLHLTLARNGTGAYLASGTTAVLTNTIVSRNTTGVNVQGTGSATLANTLWDGNTTATVGTVNQTGAVSGPAWFEADGYHLSPYSRALEQGLNAGVADDIDGESRPQPAGTAPDLGADEEPYALGEEFVVEKTAFMPEWVVTPGAPYGALRVRYVLHYYYGSPEANPPALTIALTDTLPAELTFVSEQHSPAMSFQRQGQTLVWHVQAPAAKGESGEVVLEAMYYDPVPGHSFTNTLDLKAGTTHYVRQAAVMVPVITPLLREPGNGELCPGAIQVLGTGQPGTTVTLYAGSTAVTQTVVSASGAFTMTYNYPGTATVVLSARACASGLCSGTSNTVTLTVPLSFWCPQRSKWEGTPATGPLAGQHLIYRFRNASGWFSTQNWVIPGVYGFVNTDLTLFACNCPASTGTTAPPTSVWLIADSVRYDPTGAHPWYTFHITGQAHHVVFWAQCGTTQISSEGDILVDPDGYVFDVTQGFDPGNPTQHAVSGVTVTAYVSATQWGGWVPWPAALYNQQENPQVTGADGYFAFFTPPGQYYVQLGARAGYQAWRSPAMDVVTEIVHLNVPLTPWPGQAAAQVMLTDAGPDQAVITVTVGSAVEWLAEVPAVPPHVLAGMAENPVLRVLSDLDPLTDTRGWDSGMLAPGQAYRRTFHVVGTYTYTDGQGHTAQVVVTQARLFLPVALRNAP